MADVSDDEELHAFFAALRDREELQSSSGRSSRRRARGTSAGCRSSSGRWSRSLRSRSGCCSSHVQLPPVERSLMERSLMEWSLMERKIETRNIDACRNASGH